MSMYVHYSGNLVMGKTNHQILLKFWKQMLKLLFDCFGLTPKLPKHGNHGAHRCPFPIGWLINRGVFHTPL